ncbi:MAG: hypothetical protein HY939_00320 [Gammaproteobacteria bacterium]|nr:hypothetical protein [Gammaproteobacteria bacterium]
MKKHVLFICLLAFALPCFAETALTPVSTENYFFRADYFSVSMPNEQDSLGLVGLHLAKQFDPGFYIGAGLYSSVAGQYSGFFALGGEAGWQHLFYQQVGFDTGLLVGTGGGQSIASQVGGGSFVLPHAGLFYRFPYFDLGLNYSYIRFQSNQINSQQIQLALTFPFQLYTHNTSAIFNECIPFSWSRNYIAAIASIYNPQNSQFNNGQALTNNTELLGLEFGHFFTEHLYNYFELTGAIHGNPNGYANIFAGLGWQHTFGNTSFFYSPRLALGSGGGGNYDTGGGLLVYPSLGLGWQFLPHWQIELLPGYLSSFNGHYHAITTELQIKHDFDLATPGQSLKQALCCFDTQVWRLRFGNQLYFHPQHVNNLPDDNINLLALKIDRFLQPHWYISGQTAFAYSGNAAGYFSGMLGGGYQTPHYAQMSLFLEGLLGTAGGANLAIQDGALAQLGLGIHYQASTQLGLYTQLSDLVAFKGGLNTLTLDLGLSYNFDLLGGG